ncbi:MAG: hypothetical protein VZS44_01790 [Bacilli bacterium]|nr:hypothetical protein [Bacilli bacterium]
MLEFNQDHKSADLSALRSKIKKFIYTGKVILCGVALSSILLLSGCEGKTSNNTKTDSSEPVATAILLNDDEALIMDLSYYFKDYSYGLDVSYIYNMDGDELIVGNDNIVIIKGENSHEKAEKMAEGLVSENGKITCYDEEKAHTKTR